jgi:hypothetical protein
MGRTRGRSHGLTRSPEQRRPWRHDVHTTEPLVHLDGAPTETADAPGRRSFLAKERAHPPRGDTPPTESARVPALVPRGGGGPAPYAPPPEVSGGEAGDACGDSAGAVVEEVDGEEDVGEVGDREGDHPEEGGLGAGRGEVGVEVCEGEGESAAVQ